MKHLAVCPCFGFEEHLLGDRLRRAATLCSFPDLFEILALILERFRNLKGIQRLLQVLAWMHIPMILCKGSSCNMKLAPIASFGGAKMESERVRR